MDREGVDNSPQVQWGRLQGQQVPPGQANHPPQQAISPHNAEELEAIQNGWEHELRVQRGWLNALRVLESTRERTQLQSIESSRILAKQAAKDTAEAAI